MVEDEFEGEKIEYESFDIFNELVTAPFDDETMKLLKELGLEK